MGLRRGLPPLSLSRFVVTTRPRRRINDGGDAGISHGRFSKREIVRFVFVCEIHDPSPFLTPFSIRKVK